MNCNYCRMKWTNSGCCAIWASYWAVLPSNLSRWHMDDKGLRDTTSCWVSRVLERSKINLLSRSVPSFTSKIESNILLVHSSWSWLYRGDHLIGVCSLETELQTHRAMKLRHKFVETRTKGTFCIVEWLWMKGQLELEPCVLLYNIQLLKILGTEAQTKWDDTNYYSAQKARRENKRVRHFDFKMT